MKKTLRFLAPAVLALALSLTASAKDGDDAEKDGKVKPSYKVEFYYNLDNREISPSGERFTDAMTINAAQLTPTVGLKIKQGKESVHKVMLGIDIVKNMGEVPTSDSDDKLNNSFLFKEILMYYELSHKRGNTEITFDAGVFSRGVAEGTYTHPFMSDSVYWVSSNFEGFFLKVGRPRSHYEIGLDWNGMISPDRREEFRVISYGKSDVAPGVSLGWRFFGHHYANTTQVKGVVDDFLANPFVRTDVPNTPMQELYAELSWLQGMQKDRRLRGDFLLPGGPQLELGAGKWNVFLRNRLYWGSGLMPLYESADDGGKKYGPNLYWGSPFYMVHNDRNESWKHWGTYDRMELSWEPHISKYLTVKAGAVFHFNEWKFSGWQQKLTLAFVFGN